MVLPLPAAEMSAATTPLEQVAHQLTPCDRSALGRLRQAFDASRPLAVVTGEGRLRFARLFASFSADLDADIDVLRFSKPSKDAKSCMRKIVSRIGFDTKDFSLPDLENILHMFLAYQKTHGRRTIICIEQADRCSAWVLDKLCELIQKEREHSYGLLVVLGGRPHLSELLRDGPLQAVASLAGRPISIAPLSPAESKTFVHRYLQSIGVDDAGRVIEYQGVARLHALSAGVPDVLYELCVGSLQSAERASAFPISAEFLEQVAREREQGIPAAVESLPPPESVVSTIKPLDRVVVRSQDDAPREIAIDNESMAIGRDPSNGIHLTGKLVSRNHALLVTSEKGVRVVDLGSTNGTRVNGIRVIESCVLEHGDSIDIGGFQLVYLQAEPTPVKPMPAPHRTDARQADSGSVLTRAFARSCAKPLSAARASQGAASALACQRSGEDGPSQPT